MPLRDNLKVLLSKFIGYDVITVNLFATQDHTSLHLLELPPFYTARCSQTLLLGIGCNLRQSLSIIIAFCVYIIGQKPNIITTVLQFFHDVQEVLNISGESGDFLGYDNVNATVSGKRQRLVESISLFKGCTAETFICKDTNIVPV